MGFLVKDMREIDYFDEMCEFSIAIPGSKQFESQNLIVLGFPSAGKMFSSAGEVFPSLVAENVQRRNVNVQT